MSPRGPEPGDDSSSAPLSQNLGGGAGGGQASSTRARCGHSSERSVRFLISSRRIFRFLTVCSLALTACEKQPSQLATLRDDFGDPVRIDLVPTRIVSLSPATTEFLFALGAGPRVIGRSDFDLWPAQARAIPALGNGIQPNVEAVLGIHPDLVILYASQIGRAHV